MEREVLVARCLSYWAAGRMAGPPAAYPAVTAGMPVFTHGTRSVIVLEDVAVMLQ